EPGYIIEPPSALHAAFAINARACLQRLRIQLFGLIIPLFAKVKVSDILNLSYGRWIVHGSPFQEIKTTLEILISLVQLVDFERQRSSIVKNASYERARYGRFMLYCCCSLIV